jgi:hypothetical protein
MNVPLPGPNPGNGDHVDPYRGEEETRWKWMN